jgi:hypothetical protein
MCVDAFDDELGIVKAGDGLFKMAQAIAINRRPYRPVVEAS